MRLVEVLYGKLRGRLVEIVKTQRRPRNPHGDLCLCETGSGRRYWLRSINLGRDQA